MVRATTARRTKIVCTLGPATGSVEAIEALAFAGMDVARGRAGTTNVMRVHSLGQPLPG